MQIDRKTRQMCREVERVASEVLAAAPDEELAGVFVMAVEPAPDASRLVILVGAPPRADEAATRAALERSRGDVRAAIAGALQRKRVPDVRFEVVVAPTVTELD